MTLGTLYLYTIDKYPHKNFLVCRNRFKKLDIICKRCLSLEAKGSSRFVNRQAMIDSYIFDFTCTKCKIHKRDEYSSDELNENFETFVKLGKFKNLRWY